MSYFYLDTSALVKRYSSEIGSNWVRVLLDLSSANTGIISEITMAEFGAALSAKHRLSFITDAERQVSLNTFLGHCNTQYQLFAVDRSLITAAITLTQLHPLRGYDAVQLATALTARDILARIAITDFVFVTADNNLLTTAIAEGLSVENPNNYP